MKKSDEDRRLDEYIRQHNKRPVWGWVLVGATVFWVWVLWYSIRTGETTEHIVIAVVFIVGCAWRAWGNFTGR